MKSNQYKKVEIQKEIKPQKQFKTDYGYKEPVFNPEKVPGINAMLIKGRISIDNG